MRSGTRSFANTRSCSSFATFGLCCDAGDHSVFPADGLLWHARAIVGLLYAYAFLMLIFQFFHQHMLVSYKLFMLFHVHFVIFFGSLMDPYGLFQSTFSS